MTQVSSDLSESCPSQFQFISSFVWVQTKSRVGSQVLTEFSLEKVKFHSNRLPNIKSGWVSTASHRPVIKTKGRPDCLTGSAGDWISGTKRETGNRALGGGLRQTCYITGKTTPQTEYQALGMIEGGVTGCIWLVLKSDLTGRQHSGITVRPKLCLVWHHIIS